MGQGGMGDIITIQGLAGITRGLPRLTAARQQLGFSGFPTYSAQSGATIPV